MHQIHRRSLLSRIGPAVACLALTAAMAAAQTQPATTRASALPAQPRPGQLLGMSDEWWRTEAANVYVDNVMSFQTGSGGWPKNYTIERPRDPNNTQLEWNGDATIDNAATYLELRVLAKHYSIAPRFDVLESFNRGVDFLIANQYPNGGWPQRFPAPADGYSRHVTFNDNAMVGVLRLMLDITQRTPELRWVDAARRARAQAALDRGVACILKCQIRKDGRLTGWCAQHDRDTLEPTSARIFEPAAYTAGEGAEIAMFLMSIPEPGEELKQSIESAVAWFHSGMITGKRVEEVPAQGDRPRSKRLVDDPSAPPMWARFYELETNRPIFIGRDGVTRYAIEEIDSERAYGYRWYGNWGSRVKDEHAKWKQRLAEAATRPATAPASAPARR